MQCETCPSRKARLVKLFNRKLVLCNNCIRVGLKMKKRENEEMEIKKSEALRNNC